MRKDILTVVSWAKRKMEEELDEMVKEEFGCSFDAYMERFRDSKHLKVAGLKHLALAELAIYAKNEDLREMARSLQF